MKISIYCYVTAINSTKYNKHEISANCKIRMVFMMIEWLKLYKNIQKNITLKTLLPKIKLKRYWMTLVLRSIDIFGFAPAVCLLLELKVAIFIGA